MRPSALAVLRLITNSNIVGRITGRSDGLTPLRSVQHKDPFDGMICSDRCCNWQDHPLRQTRAIHRSPAIGIGQRAQRAGCGLFDRTDARYTKLRQRFLAPWFRKQRRPLPRVEAFTNKIFCPKAAAAAWMSSTWTAVALLCGLITKAMSRALGTSSRSSSRRFGPSSLLSTKTPVALPPGRLRLPTRPRVTGSAPLLNTIGMVDVASLTARAEGPLATIKDSCRRTKSAAIPGNLLSSPSANRY